MSAAVRIPLLIALLGSAAATLSAQTGATRTLSPSPTLPSDTLRANYGPRSAAGPTPELAPTLPSDTLRATQPVDSFPTDQSAIRQGLVGSSVRDTELMQ